MMRILSPHLDDAVLSLGQFMSTIPCEVITVCAGTPWQDERVSPYDEARGFTTTRAAMAHRKSEDAAAVLSLRGRVTHLDYLDGQYLDGPRHEVETLGAIADVRRRMNPKEHFFAPLGLGHPDHRWVAEVAREACTNGELLVYEELPYRVLAPEEVWHQLGTLRDEGFTVDPITWPPPFKLEPQHLERKKAAIAMYVSQFPDGAADPCLLVPERVWRCTR